MPTTAAPMAIATIILQFSTLSRPEEMPAKIQTHVPLTPTQIGQILNGKILFANHTSTVIASTDKININISIPRSGNSLQEKYKRSQHHHSKAGAQTHYFCFSISPALNFFNQLFFAGDQQNYHQRRNKYEIVKNQVPESFQIRR